jgi:hypothetical protein
MKTSQYRRQRKVLYEIVAETFKNCRCVCLTFRDMLLSVPRGTRKRCDSFVVLLIQTSFFLVENANIFTITSWIGMNIVLLVDTLGDAANH